ncbi:MAG TPA: ABC transporter permease [Gemmatimonadales bacterium]|nr:ABC transporter permease [Gemmatimonadales bacterium]
MRGEWVTGLRRIKVLAQAEVLHVLRDKATLAQIIVMPLVQLLVLANAATFTIKDSPLYVVDQDRSSSSRGLVTRLAASGFFRMVGQSSSSAPAEDLMLRGGVTLVVTIPHDFESDLYRTGAGTVQLSLNGEKGSAAGIVQGYTVQIMNDYARELDREIRPNFRNVDSDEPGPVAGRERIDVQTRGWYNPTLDYRHYMVPGILVALVTMIGTLLSAQNIAREKEIGTLEQLNVTPITKSQFIIAKLLPYWGLAMLDLVLGLVAARLIFSLPIHGSPFLLLGAAGVYLLVALGFGLWISTVVETQQQAMFVTFFVMMVYLLMSGLFTPIESMPRWVQIGSLINPVRHFVTISRGILLKGAGLQEILTPLLTLAGFAVVVLSLAVRQYSKRTA